MSAPKITYPTKTNNPSDADNVRLFQYQNANELKVVTNEHATLIDQIFEVLGIAEGSGTIGEFVSLSILQAAFPAGASGKYAVINDGLGSTPQVATYNNVSGLWELTTPDASIIWVANVGALPATGIVQKLYVAQDTGIFYMWDGAAYQVAGPTETVVTKYILNNGNYYKTEKGHGNLGNNFEAGDEIIYRDPATAKRGVYYVKDGNLILPADLTDSNKIDRYLEQKPLL